MESPKFVVKAKPAKCRSFDSAGPGFGPDVAQDHIVIFVANFRERTLVRTAEGAEPAASSLIGHQLKTIDMLTKGFGVIVAQRALELSLAITGTERPFHSGLVQSPPRMKRPNSLLETMDYQNFRRP